MGTFDYVEFDEEIDRKQQAVKAVFVQLEREIKSNLSLSSHREMALFKLEEAYMWVGKACRQDQLQKQITTK